MKFTVLYINQEKKYSVCKIEESNNLFALKIDDMIEEGTAFFYITPDEAKLHETDLEKLDLLASRLKITVPANRFITASAKKEVKPSPNPMNNDEEYAKFMEKNIFTKNDMENAILNPPKIDVSVLKKMSANNISCALIILNNAKEEIKKAPGFNEKITLLSSSLYLKLKTSPYIYAAMDENADFYILNDNVLFFSQEEIAVNAKEHFKNEGKLFEIEKIESKDFETLYQKLENYKDKTIFLDAGMNAINLSPEGFLLPKIPKEKEFWENASIEEIIDIQNKAKSVIPITQNSKKNYDFVIANLLTKLCNNSLWIINHKSLGAKFPYIDLNGSIWIYSNEQYANEAVEHYKDMYPLCVHEITKDKIPSYMLWLREMGILKLLLNNGKNTAELSREQFLPKITELRNIISKNSDAFLFNALRFIQSNENKDEVSKKVSNIILPTMCKLLTSGVFFIPISIDGIDRTSKNEVYVSKQSIQEMKKNLILSPGAELKELPGQFKMHFISKEKSDINFIPLFTSIAQLRSSFKDSEKLLIHAVSFEQIKGLITDKINSVIDFNGINFILNEKSIAETLKIVSATK